MSDAEDHVGNLAEMRAYAIAERRELAARKPSVAHIDLIVGWQAKIDVLNRAIEDEMIERGDRGASHEISAGLRSK